MFDLGDFATRAIICDELNIDESRLLSVPLDSLSNTTIEKINLKLRKIATGYPLDYILSEVNINGLKIQILQGVFIPRPETIEWVKQSFCTVKKLELVNDQTTFVDICTGSGIISLLIAQEFGENKIKSVDKNILAVQNTLLNSQKNNFKNISAIKQNAFDYIRDWQSHNWILYCNPPYVPEIDKKNIRQNKLEFEPQDAIFSGVDGLDFFKKMIESLPLRFLPKAMFVELDPRNVVKAEQILKLQIRGFETRILKDQNGHMRVLEVIKNPAKYTT